jgi:hypothetical protein
MPWELRRQFTNWPLPDGFSPLPAPAPRSARHALSPNPAWQRREQTLFEDGDYALYRDLAAGAATKPVRRFGAICLMPIMVRSWSSPLTQVGCGGLSPMRITAILATSMPGIDRPGICTRGVRPRSRAPAGSRRCTSRTARPTSTGPNSNCAIVIKVHHAQKPARRHGLAPLVAYLAALENEIATSSHGLKICAAADPAAARLMSVPGVGPIIPGGIP